MSDAVYERYKDALRRGHVAAAAGRHDRAIVAYAQAAEIAPDRAPPLVGLGRALAAVGRSNEALAAFDRALARVPSDEVALRARADLLVARGDPLRAAQTLDRLAAALDAAGNPAAATDIAAKALTLAESRPRRAELKARVARLRDAVPEADAAAILRRAESVLGTAASSVSADVDAPDEHSAHEDQPPEPQPEPAPEPEPVDPNRLTADVEAAMEAGDAEAARLHALRAAAAHRAAGHPAAAIDACYLALPGSPFDPELHLALAEIYLDRGWRAVAADKLMLLGRLADLADDADTRARLCAIATNRLPEEPRLAARCG